MTLRHRLERLEQRTRPPWHENDPPRQVDVLGPDDWVLDAPVPPGIVFVWPQGEDTEAVNE